MEKADIKSMSELELIEFFATLKYPQFRAKQVFSWLNKGIESFEQMTNIPKDLIKTLNSKCYIANVEIIKKIKSNKDSTVKYLYKLYDGELIESVLMKYKYGYTVCISTQVGCRMGCKFCATGLSGLKRHLTASEMLAQVQKAETDNNIRISHVVMMGMGEPLDNYKNSVKFIKLITCENGMNLSARNISLSTCGLVSGIYKLMDEHLPITLSISLHAPNNNIRSKTMPVNNKWKIEDLLQACKEYTNKTGRRISFEYALIENVNDTDECAKELAEKLKGMLCHLNLIPANPVKENNFKKPSRQRTEHFCAVMNKFGINTTIRRTLGSDIDASCGQLRGKEIEREVSLNENSK